jgi:hypothetical protein
MKKSLLKKIIIVLLVLIGIYKVLDIYFTNRIGLMIKTDISTFDAVHYKDISVNFLTGSLELDSVAFRKDSLQLTGKRMELNGFSYYRYLTSDTLQFNSFKLKDAQVQGKITKDTTEVDSAKVDANGLKKALVIKKIALNDLQLELTKSNGLPLTVQKINFELNGFETHQDSTNVFPFLYHDFSATVEDLENVTSQIHATKLKRLSVDETTIAIDSIQIVPLKSRENYIDHVAYDKDLLELLIERIDVNDFTIKHDKRLLFEIGSATLKNGDFSIYGDRTENKESNKRRDLYSKDLRELPFDINVQNIDIQNSKITYEELAEKGKRPGLISFHNIEASIKDVINYPVQNGDSITQVTITSDFMNDAPLEIDWSFQVMDVLDRFKVSGSLKNVTSEHINSFLQPVSSIKTEGRVNELYFTIHGGDDASNGDIAINFENFKIKLMEEGQVRKFMSWVANLFVKNNSDDELQKVKIENLQRDKTASFWNFLWRNIESGLKEAVK